MGIKSLESILAMVKSSRPVSFVLYALALTALAVTGCSEKVEITGEVTKIENIDVSSKHCSTDEKTGKISCFSYRACTFYVDSEGILYKLDDAEDFYPNEICKSIIVAAVGVDCCEEFKQQYIAIQSYELFEKFEKKEGKPAPNPVTGQCAGVSCTYTTLLVHPTLDPTSPYDNFTYTAEFHNPSKLPKVTLLISPDQIKDKTDSAGNPMKEVYFNLKKQRGYNSSPPSSMSVYPSEFEQRRVMEVIGKPVSAVMRMVQQLKQDYAK
jgi:hypothetical protein